MRHVALDTQYTSAAAYDQSRRSSQNSWPKMKKKKRLSHLFSVDISVSENYDCQAANAWPKYQYRSGSTQGFKPKIIIMDDFGFETSINSRLGDLVSWLEVV